MQFGRRIDGVAVDRLTRSYCMYKCESTDDCRSDEGYGCFSGTRRNVAANRQPDDRFAGGDEAFVLGNDRQKFCATVPSEPVAEREEDEPQDASMSMPEDAGMMSVPDAAADAAMSASDDGGTE